MTEVKGFRGMSGCDIKLYVETVDDEYIYCSTFSQITCNQFHKEAKGYLEFVLFDQDSVHPLKQKVKNIILLAATEYGNVAYMKLHDVTLGTASWGVSVDDLIMISKIRFTAKSYTPWTALGLDVKPLEPIVHPAIFAKLRKLT